MSIASIRAAGTALLALALGFVPARADDEPKTLPKPADNLTIERARDLIKQYEALHTQQEAQRITENVDAKIIWMMANEGAMGVVVTPADDTLRSQLNLPPDQGLVVTQVAAESPAAKAGVQVKDILMQLAQETPDRPATAARLGQPDDLGKLYKSMNQSDTVELALIRAGKAMTLKVASKKAGQEAIRAAADVASAHDLIKKANDAPAYRIGVALSPADDTLRTHLGLSEGQGLVIEQVMAKSPAEKADLKVNDVLLKINDDTPTKVELVVEKIRGSEGKELSLELLRHGKPLTLKVTPEKSFLGAEPPPVQVGASDGQTRPEYRLEFVRPGVLLAPSAAGEKNQAIRQVLTQPQHDLSRIERKLEEVIKELHALRSEQDIEDLRNEVRSLRGKYEGLRESKKKD